MNRVLIIGAGPAGAACGWKLASAGIPCILADSSEFPRAKICGGALSRRAERILTDSGMLSRDELEDLTVARHGSMTVTCDLNRLRTCSGCTPAIRLVERREFDSFLRRRALEAGAEPLIDSYESTSDGMASFSSGRKIRYSRMVGADGASSSVRRAAYPRRSIRQSPSLSTVIQLSPRAVDPFRAGGLSIFFFRELYGYGWLFPRADDITVGVASHGGRHPDLRGLLGRILMHAGLPSDGAPSGAVLPAGRQPVTPGKGRILLAGDAAGLCDRITGEGIASALESGFASAEAVISGAESWKGRSRCILRTRQSLKYRKYLYGRLFRPLAMKALGRGDSWYLKYWSIVSGEREYTDLFRRGSI